MNMMPLQRKLGSATIRYSVNSSMLKILANFLAYGPWTTYIFWQTLIGQKGKKLA
jgi:hypothetical protein